MHLSVPTFKMEKSSELHLKRGMGSLCRPHRRVLPHSHSSKVTKPSVLQCRRTFFPIQSPTFRYSDGSTRIYPHCKRGKANAARQGYTHSPVFRRLATASSNTADLYGAVKTTGQVCPGTWLGNQLKKIGVNTNSKIRLPRLQVRLKQRRGLTHRKEMAHFDNSHRRSKQQFDNNSQDPDVVYRHSGISNGT